MSDHAQPHAVIQEHPDAGRAGNVDRLTAIFHPDALMSGFLMGNCLTGSPQPFYDAVTNAPAQAEGDSDYAAGIISVEKCGSVASATPQEKGTSGHEFHGLFSSGKNGWQMADHCQDLQPGTGLNISDNN